MKKFITAITLLSISASTIVTADLGQVTVPILTTADNYTCLLDLDASAQISKVASFSYEERTNPENNVTQGVVSYSQNSKSFSATFRENGLAVMMDDKYEVYSEADAKARWDGVCKSVEGSFEP